MENSTKTMPDPNKNNMSQKFDPDVSCKPAFDSVTQGLLGALFSGLEPREAVTVTAVAKDIEDKKMNANPGAAAACPAPK